MGTTRYRVRIARTDIAERVVRATDEEAAMAKVRQELEQPYAFFGRWERAALEVLDVERISDGLGDGVGPVPGGPLLLSVKDAAEHLGVSRSTLYELVNSGELSSLQIGRRRLVSREALQEFVRNASER